MAYKLFLDKDGIINVVVSGGQDPLETKQTFDDLNNSVENARSQKKLALILVDVTGLLRQSSHNRQSAQNVMNKINYDKIAIVGKGTFIKYVSNFIITASGRGNKVKYFNDRLPAFKWLKSRSEFWLFP